MRLRHVWKVLERKCQSGNFRVNGIFIFHNKAHKKINLYVFTNTEILALCIRSRCYAHYKALSISKHWVYLNFISPQILLWLPPIDMIFIREREHMWNRERMLCDFHIHDRGDGNFFYVHLGAKYLVWVKKCCHVWLDQNFEPSLLTNKLSWEKSKENRQKSEMEIFALCVITFEPIRI